MLLFLCLIDDMAIVTQYFLQRNRLKINADAECGHYSFIMRYFEMGIFVYNAYISLIMVYKALL